MPVTRGVSQTIEHAGRGPWFSLRYQNGNTSCTNPLPMGAGAAASPNVTTLYFLRHGEDVPELVGRVAKERAAYLRWGRDTVGWAIYVFRRRIPESPTSAA